MQLPTNPKYAFPLRVRLKAQTIVVRPLCEESRESLLEFARVLPERDLLFLERNIADPAEVDRWIRAVEEDAMATIVAWQDEAVVGYATFDRGRVPWTRHVAELRVVTAQSARGKGLGGLLLELVFEMALEQGVKKVVARMTPEQADAQRLFRRLGFEEEAVLRDNAMDTRGVTHDLLLLSFHTARHEKQRCAACGVPVLAALALDGLQLCAHCFETRYEELGGGD
jgi:L-amino acid N-acyltransferase YncA